MMRTVTSSPHCLKLATLCVLVGALLCSWVPNALSGVAYYGHDVAGRLTLAAHANGTRMAYSYDTAGNLLQRAFSVPGVTPPPSGDSDHDGLPDSWELQYFNSLARDGSGDFDSDGLSDLAEFLAGTDPAQAASVFRIISISPTPGVSALITWTSVPGKSYRVQFKNSPDAVSWTDLPGAVTADDVIASAVDTTINGITHRFYRVALAGEESIVQPVLMVGRTNQQVFVGWPSSTPAEFSLEAAPTVSSANWFPVTNVPSDNGVTKTVILTLDPQTPAQFYRLRR